MSRYEITISQKIELRQGFLYYRSSSDIENHTYYWREKLNKEIERLDDEINQVTITDLNTVNKKR